MVSAALTGVSPASYSRRIGLGEADQRALRKLWLFAIITLAASIIGAAFLAWEFLSFPNLFLSGTWVSVQLTNTQASLFGYATNAELATTTALEVAGIFVLRAALGELSKVDSSRFRTPRIMMLVMLVCVLATFAGRVLDPRITSPVPHWMLLIIVLLLNVANYGAIVGEIGGETLGIWRMGSRYRENLFKAASVPLIVPIVQIASPILIFIGLRKIYRNASEPN